jgi:hypothetical protein
MATLAIIAGVGIVIAIVLWLAKTSLVPNDPPSHGGAAVMRQPFIPSASDDVVLEPPRPLPLLTGALSPTPPPIPPHISTHKSQHATDTRHSARGKKEPVVEHRRPRGKAKP